MVPRLCLTSEAFALSASLCRGSDHCRERLGDATKLSLFVTQVRGRGIRVVRQRIERSVEDVEPLAEDSKPAKDRKALLKLSGSLRWDGFFCFGSPEEVRSALERII